MTATTPPRDATSTPDTRSTSDTTSTVAATSTQGETSAQLERRAASSSELARAQGEAYGAALGYLLRSVAQQGEERRVGEYLVAYAVGTPAGAYHVHGRELAWRESPNENAHVAVTIRDAEDGRFVPGLDVRATLITPSGEALGPFRLDLAWHPALYHYARSWELSEDGEYALRVRIEPPTFMRLDKASGMRFTESVDVEFGSVMIERGRGR